MGDGVWITATAGAIAPLSENDFSGNTGFGLRNNAVPSISARPTGGAATLPPR